jgi:hypothetical protein
MHQPIQRNRSLRQASVADPVVSVRLLPARLRFRPGVGFHLWMEGRRASERYVLRGLLMGVERVVRRGCGSSGRRCIGLVPDGIGKTIK